MFILARAGDAPVEVEAAGLVIRIAHDDEGGGIEVIDAQVCLAADEVVTIACGSLDQVEQEDRRIAAAALMAQ
ncbi:hypothetical protein [Cobetia sp. ICG0124]|uniref:hypothetical protein n=1 Tax=Cobetia sp. ICG0124 TaxID=2053669 RepID=UPI000FD779FA|nr:hypothetical protein [Cobetia sp. ICG0124]AZV31677.1 hypothetical protein CU110_10345 [Cobetia sp. ICG0124]